MTRYKVVETQTVTDEELEEILNTWVPRGWVYDGMQFAMRDASKRPAMAFVVFTRVDEVDPAVSEIAAAVDRVDEAGSSE
ncbi:MAG: DUF4177 domain-containing protein [Deltaproteobacteria bacterium]|nr:DUF4177 domain-containing protein [Deltaproteobacteria bacterium]